MTETHFYRYQGHQCAYDLWDSTVAPAGMPLLLIHPVGVGLSRHFWDRFGAEWFRQGGAHRLYNPDLLGCGDSEMPHRAYHPIDWAKQLQVLLQTVVQTPAIAVVQGALLPVAIELAHLQPDLLAGLVLSGPPPWPLISRDTPTWQHRLSWTLFDSPLGATFYRYARRSQFLQSFSVRQLFANEADVDSEWLSTLQQGAQNPASRHAVYAFLAGFWRQDYTAKLAAMQQPTLLVMGDRASSISSKGQQETSTERIADYLKGLPKAQSVTIPGRNVLPYESPVEFVQAAQSFVRSLG